MSCYGGNHMWVYSTSETGRAHVPSGQPCLCGQMKAPSDIDDPASLRSRLEEKERELAQAQKRVIGRCAGCGCYVQSSGDDHARAEADQNGEAYPVQCGPVQPVTVDDIMDLVDERDTAQAQAEIAREENGEMKAACADHAACCDANGEVQLRGLVPKNLSPAGTIRYLAEKIERMRAVVEAAELAADIFNKYGPSHAFFVMVHATADALAAYRESCSKEDEA